MILGLVWKRKLNERSNIWWNIWRNKCCIKCCTY